MPAMLETTAALTIAFFCSGSSELPALGKVWVFRGSVFVKVRAPS